MSAGDDLRSVAFAVFFCLMTILNAPRIVSWPITFSLLYSCYITICPWAPDARIFLKAAWDARHLYQLSDFCNEFGGVRVEPERHYPWYEPWVRCRGERWGLKIWRTYRDYTSPHFLLLYIGVLFLLYFAVKHGGARLISALNNLPLDENDGALSDNTLALPGAFNNLFPLDHVKKLNYELDKTKEELKNTCDTAVVAGEREKQLEDKLRKANARPPCPCEGIDIGFLQKRIQFLEHDLTSACGSEEHYKQKFNDLENFVAKECSSLKKQGARTIGNPLILKNAATSSKAGRNSFRSSPLVSGSATDDDENARLKERLRIAEREIKHRRCGTSCPEASANRQLKTENERLKKDLADSEHKVSDLQQANDNLTSTNATLESENSKLKKTGRISQKQVATLNKEMHDTRAILELRGVELKSAQDDLAFTKTDAASDSRDVAMLKEELRSTQSARLEAEEKLGDFERKLETSEASNSQLSKSNSQLSNRNSQLFTDLEYNKSEAQRFQSNGLDLEKKFNDQTQDLNNVQQQLTTAQTSCVTAAGTIQQAESDLKDAKQQWYNNYVCCKRLEGEKKAAQAERDAAQAESRSLRDTNFKLHQQLGTDPDSVYNISQQLKAAEEDQRQAKDQVGVLQGQIQRLKEQKPASPSPTSFASNTTDASNARSKIAQLEAKITHLLISHDEKTTLLDKNQKLILKLQKAQDTTAGPPEVDQLRRARIREQKKAEEVQGKIDSLGTELGVQRQKMDEAQKKAGEQRLASHKTIIDLREANGQVRGDLAEKTQELAKAKKRVEEQGVRISELQGIDDLF